jgi:5-methylcytosine-specific restriction endonuclease McrA
MAKGYQIDLTGENNPNHKGVEKICETCGKTYRSYVKTSRFCSISCRAANPELKEVAKKVGQSPENIKRIQDMGIKRRKPKPEPKQKVVFDKSERVKFTCLKCGEMHRASGKRKYCASCTPIPKEKAVIKCAVCNNEFSVFHSMKNRTVVCSWECRSKLIQNRQSGEQSHLWKGGLTDKNMLIRSSADYKNWRNSVFVRDDFTCQNCNQKGGRLVADHILPFSLYPLLRLEISNGRTLCWCCHSKLPTTGAYLVNAMYKEKKERGGVQLGLI